MPIRRGFLRPRRYSPLTAYETLPDSFLPQKAGQPLGVPLPNTPESPIPQEADALQRSKKNFITFFNIRLHMEEIILLGIIFVLLQEGIEDEFLLILLLFILFTGEE